MEIKKVRSYAFAKKGLRLICITYDRGKLIYTFEQRKRPISYAIDVKKAKSIADIYPNAEVYERELWEKFGIKIKGAKLKHLFK